MFWLYGFLSSAKHVCVCPEYSTLLLRFHLIIHGFTRDAYILVKCFALDLIVLQLECPTASQRYPIPHPFSSRLGWSPFIMATKSFMISGSSVSVSNITSTGQNLRRGNESQHPIYPIFPQGFFTHGLSNIYVSPTDF